MKTISLISIFILTSVILFAQNSDPYKVFGYTSKVKYEVTEEVYLSELLYIKNADTLSITKAVAFDMNSGFAFQLGANDTILDKIKIEPEQLLRWLSVDPLANKYPQLSPYTAMGNDPIRKVDPDGRRFVNFDENGNYVNTTKDNWWHNLWHGSQGRVLNSAGDVQQKFRFADPKNDVADIKSGVINKLVFVKEAEISQMMEKAGVFNPDNKATSGNDRYTYINKEGKGGGKFDFSYTAIPDTYPDASKDPQTTPSKMIFLVDGVAHNHMNFGNFLFGAAGGGLGLSLPELLAGGQWNSLTGTKNGYDSQFDSNDDQYSIMKGFEHAYENYYKEKTMVGTVQIGPIIPVDWSPF